MNHAHKPSAWRWYAGLAVEVLVFGGFVVAVVLAAGLAS